MLRDYQGVVTVKIDAIAASAASVIAMAGNKVLMSPVAMLMVHDPSTIAMGNARDMEKAIRTLNEVKESIINAYAFKTGLTHSRIAKLMENETWRRWSQRRTRAKKTQMRVRMIPIRTKKRRRASI